MSCLEYVRGARYRQSRVSSTSTIYNYPNYYPNNSGDQVNIVRYKSCYQLSMTVGDNTITFKVPSHVQLLIVLAICSTLIWKMDFQLLWSTCENTISPCSYEYSDAQGSSFPSPHEHSQTQRSSLNVYVLTSIGLVCRHLACTTTSTTRNG